MSRLRPLSRLAACAADRHPRLPFGLLSAAFLKPHTAHCFRVSFGGDDLTLAIWNGQ